MLTWNVDYENVDEEMEETHEIPGTPQFNIKTVQAKRGREFNLASRAAIEPNPEPAQKKARFVKVVKDEALKQNAKVQASGLRPQTSKTHRF